MSRKTSSWQRRNVLSALSGIATVGAVSGSATADDDEYTAASRDTVTVNLDRDKPTVDRKDAFDRSSLTADSSPPDSDLTYIDGWEGETSTSPGCTFASSGRTEGEHHCYLWMLDDGSGDPPTDGNGNYRYIIELYASSQRVEDSGWGCSGPYIDYLNSHVECDPTSATADVEFHDRDPSSIYSYGSQPVTLSMSGEYGGVGFGFSWTESWHEGYYGQNTYSGGAGGEYAVYWQNDDGDPKHEGVQGFVEISFPYVIDFDGWPYTGLSWSADVETFTS